MSRRFFAALLVLSLLTASCGMFTVQVGRGTGERLAGSGKLVTKDYSFKDFTRIEVTTAFTADISQGNNYAVSVTTDDNIVSHLEVTQDGSLVTIALRENASYGNVTLRAKITLPKLTDLEISGATNATLSGFSSDTSMVVRASGASNVKGNISIGDLDIRLTGASRAVLTGKGNKLTAHASGASTADLRDLRVTEASADANGASTIRVNASSRLSATASGASTVRYSGNPPTKQVKASDSSSIRAE